MYAAEDAHIKAKRLASSSDTVACRSFRKDYGAHGVDACWSAWHEVKVTGNDFNRIARREVADDLRITDLHQKIMCCVERHRRGKSVPCFHFDCKADGPEQLKKKWNELFEKEVVDSLDAKVKELLVRIFRTNS
jgi:hypothetical protein